MTARSVTLAIDGMHCASCVASLERALRATPGVRSASVSLVAARAFVEAEPPADEASLIAAVRGAGYEASLPGETGSAPRPGDASVAAPAPAADDPAAAEARRARLWGRRACWGVLGAAIVMGLMFTPAGAGAPAWTGPASVGLSWAITTTLLIGLGVPIGAGAVRAGLRGRATMDTLVTLGVLASYGLSVWLGAGDTLAALGHGPGPGPVTPEHADHAAHAHAHAHAHAVYFDTAAMVLALVAAGRWMEARVRARAASSMTDLLRMQPRTVRRVAGLPIAGQSEAAEVALEQIEPGQLFEVRPGERVGLDGVIVAGRSAMDESLLTGEPLAVERGPGATVFAGTLSTTGQLRVRAVRGGAGSTVAQIIEMVRRAQAGKANVERLVDRVAGWFVPVVLVVALATLLAWGLWPRDAASEAETGAAAGWSEGLRAAICVLVVACPCALGLATPMAVMVGCAVGARRGIIIKDAAAIERLARVHTVALDKTGTLTAGRPSVAAVVATDPGVDEAEVLRLAASVEGGSDHPLARAILAEARARGVRPGDAADARAHAGEGVSARVEGVTVRVERPPPAWREPAGAADAEAVLGRSGVLRLAALEAAGHTVVLVRDEQRVRGLLALHDEPRPEARDVVAQLRERGLRVVMLTGDQPRAAQALAQAVGIEHVHAALRPEEKRALVLALAREGAATGARAVDRGDRGDGGDGGDGVVMVGDGINDAPALAAAGVGVAMGHGADVAAHAGQIVLSGGALGNLPRALSLGRAMLMRVRTGLVLAFVYNAALIPAAALGLLSPTLAAGAMALSSVSVVGNALLLRGWRG